jgi:NADPH-dependent glutamate synthase beta subunit-like oxidoreductase
MGSHSGYIRTTKEIGPESEAISSCRARAIMTDQRRPRVGIIGAGVSGVLAAAHLIETSVDVTVFERLSELGGVW